MAYLTSSSTLLQSSREIRLKTFFFAFCVYQRNFQLFEIKRRFIGEEMIEKNFIEKIYFSEDIVVGNILQVEKDRIVLHSNE